MASIFGYSNTPEPEFEVVKKTEEYEVRKYAPQLRAVVAGPNPGVNRSFRTLAGYIFGGNTAKDSTSCEKIEMTAPVVLPTPMKSENISMTAPVAMQETSMSFVMPSKYKSLDQLPTPKDPNVKLIEVPATEYAVRRYSGNLSDKWNKEQEQKLREAAARDGLKLSEDPTEVQVWGYNPPWTLSWFKRNEVAIKVL